MSSYCSSYLYIQRKCEGFENLLKIDLDLFLFRILLGKLTLFSTHVLPWHMAHDSTELCLFWFA